MKVYVLLENNSMTDYEYCGVFSTEEKAQSRMDEIIKEVPKTENNLYIQEEEI